MFVQLGNKECFPNGIHVCYLTRKYMGILMSTSKQSQGAGITDCDIVLITDRQEWGGSKIRVYIPALLLPYVISPYLVAL